MEGSGEEIMPGSLIISSFAEPQAGAIPVMTVSLFCFLFVFQSSIDNSKSL
jgi:hypothetical protein